MTDDTPATKIFKIVVACGTAIGPKDFVDTIVEASATASKVGTYINRNKKRLVP